MQRTTKIPAWVSASISASIALGMASAGHAAIIATGTASATTLPASDYYVPVQVADVDYTLGLYSAAYSENLNSFTVQDYNPTIAQSGEVTTLSGNAWKRVDLPDGYSFGPNTVITLDVSSTNAGDFIGIGLGLADNDGVTPQTDWSTLKTVVIAEGEGGWGVKPTPIAVDGSTQQVYLPIGQYFNAATIDHLVVICDNDNGYPNGAANISFSNLAIREATLNIVSDQGDLAAAYSSVSGQHKWWSDVQASADGSSLTITGNSWQSAAVSYDLSKRTRISFDLELDGEPEIAGIQVISTLGTRRYDVTGTQVGADAYDYGAGGVQSFTFSVGQDLYGAIQEVVLIMDDDAATGSSDAQTAIFSNVQIASPGVLIDVMGESLVAPVNYFQFGGQSFGGISIIGDAVSLTGNTWASVDVSFHVDADTVVSVDYNGPEELEIQGIAFASQKDAYGGLFRMFQFHGSQTTVPWIKVDVTPAYTAGSGIQTISVPIGATFTGDVNHILLITDDDAGIGALPTTFDNIVITTGGNL